ncbi:MAG: RpiB/LacA/LacB family sugar-phosphate isomerase [Patescibacteria group bacterium]
MKIFFASDHAGFEFKNALVEYVKTLGFDAIDKGNTTFEALDDYPDFISLAAREVSQDPSAKGVVIGGSGQGEAIVANRFPNVRAALWYGGNMDIVKLSREHNDANVLSLGARFVSIDEAKQALKLWIDTPFSGDERHQRRIDKIENLNN